MFSTANRMIPNRLIYGPSWGSNFHITNSSACWKLGGQPLVQRLGDKKYSWDGVASLVPSMIAAGLLGYSYACPDMIGGGEYSSFQGIDASGFDQTLIVRSCQIHSMMPMMQFSVAPWRISKQREPGNVHQVCQMA